MKDGEVILQQIPFISIWDHAWFWMDKWGIPLEHWQKERIENIDFVDEPQKEKMIYFITERCENIRKEIIPEEFIDPIKKYKIGMMEKWGWPEWGYKDVKHLRCKA